MARRAKKVDFVEIPDWAIDPKRHDGAAVASALALTNNEGKWVRLTAESQRRLLGYPVFGKQKIYATSAEVKVSRKCAFGTDFCMTTYSWGEITSMACEGRKVNQ